MSQTELALEAQITPASLARIESGETRYPRSKTLATLCDALNLKEKDRLKLASALLASAPNPY
jgi:DNA-binding Xre family transcriptional regulator